MIESTSNLYATIDSIMEKTTNVSELPPALEQALVENLPNIASCTVRLDEEAATGSADSTVERLPLGLPPVAWLEATFEPDLEAGSRRLAAERLWMVAKYLGLWLDSVRQRQAMIRREREFVHDVRDKINVAALKVTLLRGNVGEEHAEEVDAIRAHILQVGRMAADLTHHASQGARGSMKSNSNGESEHGSAGGGIGNTAVR